MKDIKVKNGPGLLTRAKYSSHGTIPYIKLQTKLSFTSEKPRTRKQNIVHWILMAVIFAFILFILYYFFRSLANKTQLIGIREWNILLFTIANLFIFIYCITTQCKKIFSPDNLNIILTFPINNRQRYIGEIVTMLIKATVYNFVIFYPIVLICVGAIGAFNAAFVFTSLFSVLFMPLIPFAMSLVFAIPVVFLTKLLRNKEVVKFVLFIVLFVTVVVLYCILLSFLGDAFIHMRYDKQVLEAIANTLKKMDKWYNPAFYSSCIAINWKVGWIFLIFIGITIVFTALGICLSYPLFKSFTIADGNEGVNYKRPARFDARNAYKATYIKDFKEIFRTPAYAYFFLGVAICMPILTYMTSDLVKKLGEAKVGPETFFGLSLFIILVIVSLIGSYTANTLSREQSQFYMCKTAPVNTKRYLLTKGSVTFTIAIIGLVLCVGVLAATSMRKTSAISQAVLTPTNVLVLLGTGLLFLIGLTFNGLNLNLARPSINLKGDADEANIGIQLAIGVTVSVIISLLATTASAIYGKQSFWLYVIVVLLAFVYALVNFIVFMATAKKKFNRIEIK